MTLEEEDKIVSFDVVSIFTKVPVDEALQITSTLLREDKTLEDRTSIPCDKICHLVEICLRATYFQIGEVYYEQVEGAAMGSPLSPIIANLFMVSFEKNALDTAKHKPKIWLWYVDDIIYAVWQHGDQHLKSFYDHLNNQHPAIQFTVEEEQEGKIPFLDVMVERGETKLITSVFCKKTHTDRYMNFNSYHHPRSITSAVKCLSPIQEEARD